MEDKALAEFRLEHRPSQQVEAEGGGHDQGGQESLPEPLRCAEGADDEEPEASEGSRDIKRDGKEGEDLEQGFEHAFRWDSCGCLQDAAVSQNPEAQDQ